MSNRLKFKNAPKHHIEIANGAVIVDFYVNEKDIKKCETKTAFLKAITEF